MAPWPMKSWTSYGPSFVPVPIDTAPDYAVGVSAPPSLTWRGGDGRRRRFDRRRSCGRDHGQRDLDAVDGLLARALVASAHLVVTWRDRGGQRRWIGLHRVAVAGRIEDFGAGGWIGA